MHMLLLFTCLVLQLTPVLLRGPYLQSATSESIVIRWRTDTPTDSRVWWGDAPGMLAHTVDSTTLVTEHEVKITGLQPKHRYYYAIGSAEEVLQGDAENFFETTPLPGQPGKYRIGVLGDCGNNSANQLAVRDQLAGYLGPAYMDAWLLLGDNAYMVGSDAEYQSGFFNMYKEKFLKQSPLYPCPGNHEYANNASRQIDHAVPYYQIFTLPGKGEAGGVPSGTEAFYAFDYGNIHFLSLDSYGKEDAATRLYDTLGTQVQWVKADLAANDNKDWVVAYWHHPPYTKGSHDSDTEAELVKLRENFIRILERNGVDLILCGHSHDYERSRLMAGHYGIESTFDPQVHALSRSSGRYDGSTDSCPYVKSEANSGTVYVVAGSAGQLGAVKAGYPHDALPFATNQQGGALLLDVEGNRLDAKWIASDGTVRDQFTIVKNVNQKKTLMLEQGQNITLSASYAGNYLWNTGATTRSITVSPNETTEYIVHDNYACLADTITVRVSNPLPVRLVSFSGVPESGGVTLQWQTAAEVNAGHFRVERSWDGRNFEGLGEVKAAGNTRELQSYAFRDQTVGRYFNDPAYYRLVETDLDGKQQTSRIIAVKLGELLSDKVVIRPNPSAGGETTIEVAAELGGGQVMLMDMNGRILQRKALARSGRPQWVSFGKLRPGTYMVTATLDQVRLSKKLVIQ